MKLKYKMIIIIMVVGLLLIGVATVGIINSIGNPLEHKMEEGKTYHVASDMCYYTTGCKHCGETSFSTDMDFWQILGEVGAADKIVLEEDLIVPSNIVLNGYNSQSKQYKSQVNINIDLNNYTIKSDANNSNSVKALFDLQAVTCSINLNISNGNLDANKLLYVFDFTNLSGKNITLCLDGVKCTTVGENTAPLFAHNTSSNMKVTANNCEFIAEQGELLNSNRVAAFINSSSEFNFNNCKFLGGDAIHVKEGRVNLKGCQLINSGLGDQTSTIATDTFSAAGRCLTAVTHNYNNGNGMSYTKYNISIDKCEFLAQTSHIAVLLAATGGDGIGAIHNPLSSINITSARFNSYDVTDSLNHDIVTKSTSIQTIGEDLFLIGNDF